jgi:hypothetical protein
MRGQRRERKVRLVALLGGCCHYCGYDDCLGALEFHHVDPSKKRFNIGGHALKAMSWDDLVKEAKKCLVVCSRCHREIHWSPDVE